jgi:hypothetical protein
MRCVWCVAEAVECDIDTFADGKYLRFDWNTD